MPQEFILLITAAPEKTQAHLTAIRYLTESVKLGHKVLSVFFYQDAVLVANKFNAPPSDEPQISEHWQSIANEHSIELQCCVAASYRRGIADQPQAETLDFEQANQRRCFKMAGLGQLAAALSNKAVKLIHFR